MELKHYPDTPRLVNRFSLGADPEFVLHDLKNRYIYAETLGMTTMHAFGCDMSGRQAEIRAYPSRFALEVIASIVDSLRWMGYAHALEVLPLKWVATAFNGKDGCGGHIHFGRRRPGRNQEVDTLDRTTKILLEMGVIDKERFRSRQRDNPNQHYGQYGDIRPQAHGFEYRTLSTQMANPWLAYFVMVVNKLALYERQLWSGTITVTDIMMLLQKYTDRDDDAAIALQALKIWGLPKESLEDFKQFWGVDVALAKVPHLQRHFFPSTIKPEEATCRELFEYLTKGTALPKRTPLPTWEHWVLPEGFGRVQVQMHTLGHLPDIGMDLVSKHHPVSLYVGGEFGLCEGSLALPKQRIKEALRSCIPNVRFFGPDQSIPGAGIQIYVTTAFNKSIEQCKFLHKILSDTTLFPVCKAKDLNKVDWSRWESQRVKSTKPELGKFLGKIVGKPVEPVKKIGYYDYEHGGIL